MPLLFLSLLSFTLRSTSTVATPISYLSSRPISRTIFSRSSLSLPFTDPINPSVDACLDGVPFYTNYRSLWEIVWTCWVTIFACIWISVHPNVRGHKATWGAIMRQRAELLFWGFIAPEVMVVWAYRQWIGAREISKAVERRIEQVREKEASAGGADLIEWTNAHSHMLQMGGYIFEQDGAAPRYVEVVVEPPMSPIQSEKSPEFERSSSLEKEGPEEVNEERKPSENGDSGQSNKDGNPTLLEQDDSQMPTSEKRADMPQSDDAENRREERRATISQNDSREAQDSKSAVGAPEEPKEVSKPNEGEVKRERCLDALIRRRDTQEELQDRSKGDAFTKGVVLFQTGWFVAQIIARRAQNLAITELEITTLAYAAMTAAMYLFWWDKPLDVQCPIIVGVPPSTSQDKGEEDATGGPPLHASEARPVTPQYPVPSSPHLEEHTEAAGVLGASRENAADMAPKVAIGQGRLEEPEKDESNVESEPLTIRPIEVDDAKNGPSPHPEFNNAYNAYEIYTANNEPPNIIPLVETTAKEGVIYTDNPPASVPVAGTARAADSMEPDSDSKSEDKSDSRSQAGGIKRLFLRLEGFIRYKLLSGELEDNYTEGSNQPLAIRMAYLMCFTIVFSPILVTSRVVDIITSDTIPPDPRPDSSGHSRRVSYPTFYAFGDMNSSTPFVAVLLGSTFGAIHCAAWNFIFHLSTYRILWQTSSLYISLSPIATLMLSLLFVEVDSIKPEMVRKAADFLLLSTAVGIIVIYGVARWILVVLTLIELSHLPPTAYQTVEWTDFLPHA